MCTLRAPQCDWTNDGARGLLGMLLGACGAVGGDSVEIRLRKKTKILNMLLVVMSV